MLPVFNKTLHEKFWSSFKNGMVTKHAVLVNGVKDKIFTLKEFEEIVNANQYCLACQYDLVVSLFNNKQYNQKLTRCDNCPLEVPEEIKNLNPYKKTGCLDGLWDWYVTCLTKYKFMEHMKRMDIQFCSIDDGMTFKEILEQCPYFTVKVIDDIKDSYKDIVFSDWQKKAYDDIRYVAKLISELPVKKGVEWI